MNRVLQAIAEERSELAARLRALEEMERIAREAVGAMLVPGVVSEAEAREVVSLPRKAKAKARREPVRALPPGRRSQPQPERRSRATPSETAELAQRIRSIVAEHEPITFRDIVKRSGASVGRVKTALLKLRDAGLVDATGVTASRRYHLQATLDAQTAAKHGTRDSKVRYDHMNEVRACRDEILATIRSEPGQWTEQRLTDAGAFDREQVADACGYLLEDGLVVLNADGTYGPAVLGLETAA